MSTLKWTPIFPICTNFQLAFSVLSFENDIKILNLYLLIKQYMHKQTGFFAENF
jgi:hypothetical protein